ncbi:HAD family hydrolase [Acetatifactor muris]|uniref:Pyrimidine 5'-nucleotidase YjjG n=1 Tax=Acetatifactor muris TaxID=879566 RepID=A0A2K4ZIZ9_9FIRM|nr:HAD family hydrolase [Acetatifactor muris]MCR2045966.1 HAD family hydrolase [Acetatifactor muris]SOY30457.1 Pyrimidine 5'-nucleotidase YjjG [Acetatifactor muris]
MNKAVFWDFDGTLVHSNESFLCSLSNSLLKYNYIVERHVIRDFLTSVCTWNMPQRDYADMIREDWWNELLDKITLFCNKYGIEKEDSVLICKGFKENVIHYEYKLYDDAEKALSSCKLKGYNNYLLTNNFPEIVQVVERYGLDKYFCDYFVSTNIGYEKPRIEIFNYALRAANHPDVCYMVGDNPIADINGAQKAGIKTILVHNKSNSIFSDFCCEELLDITKIILD